MRGCNGPSPELASRRRPNHQHPSFRAFQASHGRNKETKGTFYFYKNKSECPLLCSLLCSPHKSRKTHPPSGPVKTCTFVIMPARRCRLTTRPKPLTVPSARPRGVAQVASATWVDERHRRPLEQSRPGGRRGLALGGCVLARKARLRGCNGTSPGDGMAGFGFPPNRKLPAPRPRQLDMCTIVT